MDGAIGRAGVTETMNENRLTGLMSALCMALMLALMWVGGAAPIALLLVVLGAALMATVCVLAELLTGAGRST